VTVLRVVLLALAAFFAVATALPLADRPYWWVRAFDFPRLQLAAGALVVLVAFALVAGPPEGWEWAVLGVLAACVLYQTARTLPYTPLWKTQSVRVEDAPAGRSLRVVVSNVRMENRDAGAWARVVAAAEPDVVAAVEVDDWWLEHIRAALPEHPHRVEVPQDNTYGMVLFARLPLEDAEVRHLVEETVPSIFARVVLPSGERVRMVVVHPRPPRPDIPQGSEFRDAELVRAARALEDEEGAVLVAGDLNDVAWSATTRRFQQLSGLLDPRIGRGLFPTFPVKYPFLRYPLDHVFHSEALGLVELRRLGAVGSDHFPMLIEVALAARAEAEQEAPAPDAEDRREGAEAVAEAEETLREESPGERQARDREDR
jgi:endonuclease/exonuclease/phosphatase (EEP) superfamily protein YafD